MPAAQSARRVPTFYLCDDSLPRTGALFHGAVLAAAFLAGACLLIARGGSFLKVAPQPAHSYLPASRASSPRTEPARSASVPFYFRQLAIVSALDANHDGVISAAEIAAAPITLAALDADHDGILSADECGGNFANGLAVGSTAGDPNTTSVPLPSNSHYLVETQFLQRARLAFMRIHPIVAVLDADHNGEISTAEIRNAPAILRTLDRNGDGRLTVDEIIPDPVASAASQFICIFDINNDGALSPEEWTPIFGKRLRRALTRAGSRRGSLVSVQDLASAINSASAAGDPVAYKEMLHATHDGFAAILSPVAK